jgi:hypothetical protein
MRGTPAVTGRCSGGFDGSQWNEPDLQGVIVDDGGLMALVHPGASLPVSCRFASFNLARLLRNLSETVSGIWV